uniref:leprecan protein isoform X3 n=1 Tax=Ciona intestinalis TaxID=7719 RepID=UPI000EF48123|nr:leprecan protein isoform X3 [Ciona intestinalis]|eukprot:XP_026691137.1 leprecan protein isoform X3 [Ciona intestinalis]
MACPDEAARVNANSFINNFVPKVYHYLQFAYYHVGKHWQAAQAAKSYLLFFPENVLIKNNLNHFENSTDAKPKEDVSLFHRRLKVQSKILRHIYQNFGIRNFSESLLNPYMEEDDGDSEENNNESSENVVDSTENNADLAENEDSIVGEMGDISKNTEDTEDNGDSAENIELKENSDKSTKNVAATLKQVEPPKESKTQAKVEYNSMKDKTKDMIEAKDAYNARMEVIRKKREAESDVDISHMLSDIGHEVIDSNSIISIIDSTSLPQPPTPEGPLLHNKVVMLSNSTQMAGPLRFAVDGFASEQQCQDLIDLELSGGVLGDGYMGRVSPHSEHELFQGMTVYLAAKLAEKGKVPPQTAALYYKLSEEARLQVKMYFKLTQELYFDYTHLVCRTTVKGKPVERTDLSHPVHSDNCLLKENGSCLKERPAYTWRDYSAILYLNDEFEGGEFIMTDATARRVKVQVRPKCGRLVSFSAGKECLHGVKPVTKGRRCAMALWFTMDPTHNEEDFVISVKEMASRLLVVHLISILCCLCVFGTVQSQGKGRDTARLDKDEVSISDGPGGSCKVIVSSRCCTVDRVVRQVLRVKCECTTGYAAGTTRSQPSCVPGS